MGPSRSKEADIPMAIDYAKQYQNYIDEELAASSATEWMAAASGQVRYGDGKEVEIATLSTTGLGNYDSSKTDGSAYPNGAVTSKWTAHTLEMDRGVKFALDRVAPEDLSFPATAENVIREFARNQLAREQDAYRISRLYTLAYKDLAWRGTHVLTYDSGSENLVDKLCGLVQTLEDDSQRTGGFVAMIASNLKNEILRTAADNYNNITFEQQVEINGVTYSHVMMINDLPCIFVPPSRMNTVLSIQSGRDDQAGGGVVAAEGSKRICALVTAWDTPIAISRIDSLKQFGPEENQLFDGTAIQARYLYDLVVPKDKTVTIGALVSA